MNNEKIPDKYLPIGTVCLLKKSVKRVMITGFLMINPSDNKKYDYMGCLYPEGILKTDHFLLFNHDDITSVAYMGYDDVERKLFNKRLNELEEQ